MSDEPKNSLNRAILQTLESLQAAGVQQLAKTQAAPKPLLQASSLQRAGAPPQPQSAQGPVLDSNVPTVPNVPTTPTLELLQAEVAACTLCEELAPTRTQTVFGVGNPDARLCILGEAPGEDEDRLGEPFVGRGGQLLNKILAACQLEREDVYLLNILRCRPPSNRNPKEEEAKNCRQFLERQLQLIDPEFICCMGAVAAQNLLSTTVAIGRLRGKIHDYRGMKVVCTYHPAYLLRNPSAKKNAWEDMKMLMREMETPVD